MWSDIITNRYLNRLRAPAGVEDRSRVERVLASARLVLSAAGLVAISVDRTEPARYATLAYGVLAAYLACSAAIWVVLRVREEYVPRFQWMHWVDVIFPVIFTLFTQGPSSPFFLYFTFTVTSTAYRWGFPETVATATGIAVLVSVEAELIEHSLIQGGFELNRFIIRGAYLILIGVLLGFLAEEEKQVRAENAVITRVVGRARADHGLRGTMQGLLGEMMQVFASRRVVATLRQARSGQAFLWGGERPAGGGENRIESREVSPAEAMRYLFPIAGQAFYAERRGSAWDVVMLNAEGGRMRVEASWKPLGPSVLDEAQSLMGIQVTLGEEWSGRLALLDPRLSADKLKELRFAQRLVRQAGPAIYSVYLLRRLRSRAGALERARVARELHDGAIQALIAVEMQVDVLRRQAGGGRVLDLSTPLERIQRLLQDLVVDLRSLMQQMRPVELKPGQFLDFLADLVTRFRRDRGIAISFVSEFEEVDLPGRVGRELVRIVQEALVNVRKHAGARSVLVRFAAQEGKWKLEIEDDGHGFDFVGRMSLGELEAMHKGPAVIMERVRGIGGEMSIQSLPGRGTHIEITFPQKQVAYA